MPIATCGTPKEVIKCCKVSMPDSLGLIDISKTCNICQK